ncbi:MAG TPA: thioredoxin domain-containing protein [Methanoregula sp.]|nr:thioredoxin domain-containing protein [Methanoregula sp.]
MTGKKGEGRAEPPPAPPRNRLAGEKSPYLIQHSTNPVDWYPWGEEAFSRAAREEKPVFLSIGYATCHWCHVMEHESFENNEVAALLNRDFVSIKVDREERPDIDSIYMDAALEMTGRGGWPLTIIMTPDKKPFFSATYLPKNGRFGMAGLLELLPRIAGLWRDHRADLEKSGGEILLSIGSPQSIPPATAADAHLLTEGYEAFSERFDDLYGGFGNAPKFPSLHSVLFLFRFFRRSGKRNARDMAVKTLRAVTMGGIYDHLGGGVHRYATDRRWQVPHFEKMLYDQALLLMACSDAYQITGLEEFRQTADEVVAYVTGDLASPEGMFCSAEDADSAGGEGFFYLWTAGEIERILGGRDAGLANLVFNIEQDGNFDGNANSGLNVLYRTKTYGELASRLNVPEQELAPRIRQVKNLMSRARLERPRPFRDDKVLTDWNSLFIGALARAAFVFDNREYLAIATAAMDALLDCMRTSSGGLFHRYRDGEAGIPAFGSDYAFTIFALIRLYGAGFDPRHLRAARELQDYFSLHFSDAKGGFFSVSDESEQLPFRKKEIYDGAIPSCNSMALDDLLMLTSLTGEERFSESADATLRAFAAEVRQSPAAYGYFLCALDQAIGPVPDVVIAGQRDDPRTIALTETVRSRYLPDTALILLTGENREIINSLAPFTREMKGTGNPPAAYVCSGRSCAEPVTDAAELGRLLDKDTATGDNQFRGS